MSLETLNTLIGTATVLAQIATLGLIALYFMREPKFEKLLVRGALLISFLFATFGVVMSLVYSEYFGIIPCGLCWLGRIFLYPQAIMFAIASWKRDANIAFYSIALSVCGLLVSLYHHNLQMGGASVLPCPASGAGDCAQRFLFEYGYVTFPLVGATSFALLIALMLFVRRVAAVPSN